MHPNGQMPAYEWNFGDVNPPVHAWATLFIYRTGAGSAWRDGRSDLLKLVPKLLLNFTWWVNRKDRLGQERVRRRLPRLDNIGVFDRSAPLPTGGPLEQADGTAWMALFGQNMLEIAIELAGTIRSTRTWRQVLRPFLSGSPRRWTASGRRRDVGRRGWLLLRRAAAAGRQRHAAQGPLDGRTAAALRHHRVSSTWQREPRSVEHVRCLRNGCAACRTRARDHPAGPDISAWPSGRFMPVNPESEAAPDAGAVLDESEFLSPFGIRCAVHVPRGRTRTCSTYGGQELLGRPTCRRNRTPACSAATPTGADRSGCRSTC